MMGNTVKDLEEEIKAYKTQESASKVRPGGNGVQKLPFDPEDTPRAVQKLPFDPEDAPGSVMQYAGSIKDYGDDYMAARAAGDADGMQAANDGANALRIAAGEMPQYATDDINTIRNQNKAPAGFTGSASNVGTHTTSQDTIRAQMNANSKAWHETNDPAERKRLERENIRLAGLLGGTVSFDSRTGTWSGSAEQEDFSYKNAARFTDKYSGRIQSALDSLLGRGKFEYDAESDPLYQQYRQQYTAAGQQAMQDTLGQVSARTGGLASSYAGTASQQAYNNYMAQLANKVPELYQLAYSMYQDELANYRNDLSLLQSLSDSDYNRFNMDRNFDYNVWQGNESQRQWQEGMDYQRGRDAVSDQQWNKTFDYNAERDSVADQQWNKTHDLNWWEAMNQKQQQEISNAFTLWSVLGEADAEVSRILGVPVGTKTTDWRYNLVQMQVMQK